MVTKPSKNESITSICLILAKNHMVTKHSFVYCRRGWSLILAKNHMVTKPHLDTLLSRLCLILAKNHMVTKPQIHVTIYLKIIKY